MADHAFFYGTLMRPFNRPGRQRVEPLLAWVGRGQIPASLYDIGIYPAAVPTEDQSSRVWGELYRLLDPAAVLAVLDEIEGHRPAEPERSLYTRVVTTVTLADRRQLPAWTYFYNAPLGRAPLIAGGDYLEYLNVGPQMEPG